MQSSNATRSDEPAFDQRLTRLTTALLDEVWDCVGELAVAFRTAGEDDAAFAGADERLATAESAGNEAARGLRAAVGEVAALEHAGLYVVSADVIGLVGRIESIGTEAERVVREVAAMRPALSVYVRAHLVSMTDRIVEAVDHLRGATLACIRAIVAGGSPTDIDAAVTAVRDLESTCDEHKYAVLDAAFAAGRDVDALVCREVVVGLDEVANAVERAADDLAYIATRVV